MLGGCGIRAHESFFICGRVSCCRAFGCDWQRTLLRGCVRQSTRADALLLLCVGKIRRPTLCWFRVCGAGSSLRFRRVAPHSLSAGRDFKLTWSFTGLDIRSFGAAILCVAVLIQHAASAQSVLISTGHFSLPVCLCVIVCSFAVRSHLLLLKKRSSARSRMPRTT